MALSGIDKYNQEIDNFSSGLIDADLLQKLQDQFCRSNGMYLVCLGKSEGVITKAYGSKEELDFLHSVVDKDMYVQLVTRLERILLRTW